MTYKTSYTSEHGIVVKKARRNRKTTTNSSPAVTSFGVEVRTTNYNESFAYAGELTSTDESHSLDHFVFHPLPARIDGTAS
jgi:hypothetical protein